MLQEQDDESELQVRQEHLGSVARRMEEQIATFAKQYGPFILRGQPLPVDALERFRDLALDSRNLVNTVERLEILTGCSSPTDH